MKNSTRTLVGHMIAGGVLGLTAALLLILWVNSEPAHADSTGTSHDYRVPTPGHPIVNLKPGTHEVSRYRTVYVEMIVAPTRTAPGYSYVQYNTGAEQFVRNCNRPMMKSCVDPTTGIVGLDDGSLVRMARWAKR